MRIVVPPGQRLPSVSASVSLDRTEANELLDALKLALEAGRSRWNVYIRYAEIEADVTLMLELEPPGRVLDSA